MGAERSELRSVSWYTLYSQADARICVKYTSFQKSLFSKLNLKCGITFPWLERRLVFTVASQIMLLWYGGVFPGCVAVAS